MDFGKFIRAERLKAGLSMSDVVKMTGGNADKTTLSRVENNERGISLQLAFYLSEIYGIDFKTLAKMKMGKEAKIRQLTAAEKKKGKRGRPPKK